MKVGYIRVSSFEQNTERQLQGIELDEKFEEKISGKSIDRPKLQELLKFIRKDDEVLVHSMDRLGRNVKDLLDLVEIITKKGASITFKKENLTFKPNEEATPINRLMLQLIGAIAEFERNLILERQREGIAIAKSKGAYKGSQKRLAKEQIELLKEKFNKHEMSVEQLGKAFNISRKSVYNYIKG